MRLKILYRRYVRATLRKHAFAANVLVAGTLMMTGDALQQVVERRGVRNGAAMDHERSVRLFLVGLMEGPLQYVYYTRLDRLLPGRALPTVVKKVALDQTVAAPLFISVFFYGSGLLEGRSLDECGRELRRNIWTVYLADCLVWPPSQFLNFYLVPAVFRITYINLLTCGYNMFLSYVKHRDDQQLYTA